MFDTSLSFFEKKKKEKTERTSTKKVYCHINRSQNQAGTLFQSINPLPECSGSFVRSISRESLLEFGFRNAIQESVDCIHHSIVQTELTTPQQFLQSRKQPEITLGQIRIIRRVLHCVDLLASQLSFHSFGGVRSSVIMVQDPLMRQFQPLHSNTQLQLLQYPVVILRINFHFLGKCLLINGSSTVEKNYHVLFTIISRKLWKNFVKKVE